MRAFATLYTELDRTTSTRAKVAALAAYLRTADPLDAAWTLYVLSGRRPKRLVPAVRLRAWAREEAGLPEWLLQECHDAVGDTAETIALVLPEPAERAPERPLHAWIEDYVLALRGLDEPAQRARVLQAWRTLPGPERFVFNKLLTGGFRVGVSQGLLVRALAEVSGLAPATIAHRLMGAWEPGPDLLARLLDPDATDADRSRPYPFALAHALEQEPAALGPVKDWQAEWKWDGIRAQLVRRAGRTFLWTRGEELVTARYPEVAEAAEALPDGTVLDGELLAWKGERPLPFAQLQRRIGRRAVGRRLLREVPVVFVAFDLLEAEGADVRSAGLAERRARLEAVVARTESPVLRVSEVLTAASWDELARARARSRDRGTEGLLLKRRDAPYPVGRVRGVWWKWKVEPFTVDAVLVYAQRGSGRRASLYSDYTFALRDGDDLVPFAKAYSGLTDEEIRRVDRWVRRHTLDRFGPVRRVPPHLVFELAFEGIQRSARHRSGLAVRFPRILRWREDKTPDEIDCLEDVRALLDERNGVPSGTTDAPDVPH